MTNYDKKEEKVLDDIAKVMEKLDKYLDEEVSLEDTPDKKYEIKKWYVQRRALHEIKRLLHDVDKYDKYEAKELEQFEKDFEGLGLDVETVAFITNYF
ncbi:MULTISPECIES: hypothetical protein [Enterococcaceae]|uniref:hypothetical protein n=1 Tax=Enterococcaceae TaxID=81852 RepID=UPI000E4D57FB|nr:MULTISPECIES: hypothetical protein [Enterococcaceae]MCI0130571.1 hypothetical protein [Vagococcus sp. CY53-2]RGI32281.1 hypothetical protein DXC12_02985 [Melissococcus sp. OM08-11BH]